MALVKQTIEIPLAGGLQTKADPKVVPPGSLLALENAEFDKLGAITKRNGYAALTRNTSSGTALAAGRAVFRVRDELVGLDGEGLYSYTPTANRWQAIGDLKALNVRTTRVASGGDSAGLGGLGYANNIAVIAWRDSGVKATVLDTQTGGVIVSATTLESHVSSTVNVITSGRYIYVLTNDSGNDLDCHVLDTLAPASGFTTNNLKTDNSGACNVPAMDDDGAGVVVCAYETTTPSVHVFKFNQAGVTAAGTNTAGENPAAGIMLGLFRDTNGDVYVAFKVAGNNIRCFALDTSLASIFTPVTIEASAGTTGRFVAYKSGANVVWFYNAGTEIRKASIDVTGTVTVAAARWIGGIEIMSQWLTYTDATGTHRLLLARYDSTAAATFQFGQFLIGDDGKPYASFLRNQENQLTAPTFFVSIATGVFWGFTAGNFASTKYFPSILEVDFNYKPESAKLGENLHITGGLLWEYDGSSVFENGFLLYPDAPALTPSASGGSLADGVYQVVAFYEWTDARGQIHRSAISEPTTATVSGGGGSGSISAVVSTLRVSHRTGVIIRVAITDPGDTTFYVWSETTTANDATANSVTILMTDPPDADDPAVYTDGGVLDNFPPTEPFFSIVRKGERLYGVDQRGHIEYTRRHVQNEAAAFGAAFLSHDITEEATDSTYKISEMDGALLVFGESSVQAIQGDGPTENGEQNDLQDARSLATDVGHVPGSPIVKSDVGLFFKSGKGLCLLSRSFQIDQAFATPVDAYKALTMASGVAVPSKNQVRFGHSDGVTLAYDYVAQQWSVFTNHAQVDAVLWGGRYCLLRANGTVWQQSDGYADGDGAAISMIPESPWIKLSGMQGYQRLYYASLLGEWRSDHTLTLKVYYDYNPNVAETVTFTATGAAQSYVAGEPLQIRHHLGKKCQAVKFRVEDSNQAGTKESYSLTGIALELGGIGGVFRQGRSKTI